MLTAIVIISMALTPLAVLALRWVLPREPEQSHGRRRKRRRTCSGSVLIIGFGRFGQIASQALLARGIDVAIIDNDTDMIRSAGAVRLQGLLRRRHAAGRAARLRRRHAPRPSLVCVDKHEAARASSSWRSTSFPQAKLLVRAFDREHALELIAAGVDYQMRETFESAMAFGEAALRALGVAPEEAAAVAAEVRRRDAERLELQVAGDMRAGIDLMHSNRVKPTPLTKPARAGQALNDEAAAACAKAGSGD